MKIKSQRLDAIRLIISHMEICSQEELKEELLKEGYNPTQATLSRDLKQLSVVKSVGSKGKYRYVLPSSPSYIRYSEIKPNLEMGDIGFLTIKFSGNLAVIRTLPSYAGAIAYRIDNHNIPIILGTIAGDDTIFLVLSEEATRTEVMKQLSAVIPNL